MKATPRPRQQQLCRLCSCLLAACAAIACGDGPPAIRSEAAGDGGSPRADIRPTGTIDDSGMPRMIDDSRRSTTTPPGPQKKYRPSYPRVGIFHFGNAPAAFYARHDLVMVSNASVGDKIRAINPSAVVLITRGWSGYNSSYFIHKADFDRRAFLARTSAGGEVRAQWSVSLIDQSIEVKQRQIVAAAGPFRGLTILEALPKAAVARAAVQASGGNDGVATDWLWQKPHGITDIDLDRDGKNDYRQHGRAWVEARWLDGTAELLRNARRELDAVAPGRPLLINFGYNFLRGDRPGDAFYAGAIAAINGMVREHTTGFAPDPKNANSFELFMQREYRPFIKRAPLPHVAILDGRPHERDPYFNTHPLRDSRNHLQALRYLLGVALMGDAYFDFFPLVEKPASQEHHVHAYYDEYDANLGQPTREAREVADGIWLRCFDRGAVVLNVRPKPQQIKAAALAQVCAHASAYYRMSGGQDLALNGAAAQNSGAKADLIHLAGYLISASSPSNARVIGDALILLDTPEDVVAPIVVDNATFSTSPASAAATLRGFAQQQSGGSEHYSLFNHKRGRTYSGKAFWPPYAKSTASGAAASYHPRIGVPGRYRIYEWHGLGAGGAAHVKLTIRHGGGETTVYVDQSQGGGRWRQLGNGSYRLDGDAKEGVTIFASGAGAAVLADAIKFEFAGR